jgi:hypothetical protein
MSMMNSSRHKLIKVTRLIALPIALQIPNKTLFAQQKKLTRDELTKEYTFPDWSTKTRFGIWVHWGAQSEPDSDGGWYAPHMYMQDVGTETWGKNAYPYQINHFGHPSKKGFKDVINAWKAENLKTDSLLRYFKSIGTKFFMALANHHGHFDNFNSTYHQWNSVNVGPHKDIIGLFSKSTYNIPFGVSSHDDRFLTWWFMMPFYYGSKACSVPEYLKVRFDDKNKDFQCTEICSYDYFLIRHFIVCACRGDANNIEVRF